MADLCSPFAKKVKELYSDYLEESFMFESSLEHFNYLITKLKQLKSELSESEFRSILQEGYDDSLQGDTNLIDNKAFIIDSLKTDFPAESLKFFTEGNMLLLWNEGTNNVPVSDDSAVLDNNNEMTLTESLENALDLGKEFLFTYFKDSTDMKDDFEKIAKNLLVKSFLVDYENGIIVEKHQLNDLIRATLQNLVNQIIDYLKQLDGKSQKGIYVMLNGTTYRISNLPSTDVFYDDHSSTGLWEALLPVLKLYLNVFDMSTSMLNEIHKNKYNDLAYYDAIMAVTLLKNYNSYLKSIFGKNLDIQNSYQGLNFEDSYFFNTKGDGNITTYRVDENPDVIKETNSITKLIFETVPYYVFNTDKPLPGQYLNFPQSSRVIADIKSLGKKLNIKSKSFYKDLKDKIDSKVKGYEISNDAQEVLNENDIKSIADIIAKIRSNPLKYFSVLLELLCNPQINDDLKLNLNSHVLNIMYSMYCTLFSNQHNSLRKISKNNHRLYPQITLFVDTVYKIELVLYNTNDEGINQTVLLAENEVNNQKNYFEQSVFLFNAKSTGSYFRHKEQYNIRENEGKEFKYIEFDIPRTNYTLQVAKTGNVKIFKEGKVLSETAIKELINNSRFRWFVEDILHLQLGSVGNDSEFFTALKSIQRSSTSDKTGADKFNKMVNMAARVLLFQHAVANVSDSTPLSNYVNGDIMPKNHKILKDELMMIANSDFKDVVIDIAEARCIVNGNVTASQVKNGEGKSLSLTTLSRLMNSKNSQWKLLNSLDNSAVKEFSLYDLIEDVYVTIEKHDLSTTKPVNKFSISEGIYSLFVLDFVSGLVNHSNDRNVFGNGKIGILSSVNSDKNTVAKLVLNLSSKMVTWKDSKGKVKQKYLIQNNAINVSNLELMEIINYELGNYYYKHMQNVLSDWITLLNHLNIPIKDKSIHELINAFNQAYEKNKIGDESHLEYLSRVVAKYNLTHTDFLEFIDQIHYIETEAGFTFNKTTESLLCRFLPSKALEFGLDPNVYLSSEEFWQELDFNLFKSLFESDFQLKLINTKNVKNATNLGDITTLDGKTKKGPGTIGSPEHDLLLSDTDWVRARTKEFIYAKIKIPGNNEIANITSSLTANRAARKIRDYLFSKIEDTLFFINGKRVYNFNSLTINDMLRLTTADGKPVVTFELNNKLKLYNYLDYLFSLEYLISTVGSHIAHPDKNKIDIADNSKLDTLSEESARFNAQHKRNVSQTATMKEYQLNDIFGVATDMNVAVVKDIIDFLNTVNGDTDKIKPYDGACIVNPFMVLLENYSLGADAAGYVKKPFFHAFKERFGTGIIIKTAGFGITNDNLRNLAGTKILMKKMTNRRWRHLNGEIITDYNIFASKIPGGTFSGTSYDQIFYMKDGVIYQRKLEWDSGMTYKVTDWLLNEDGEKVNQAESELIIDTNYKLWQAFGAEYSCHKDKTGKYVYDENSIEAVVEIMNSTGYVVNHTGEIRYLDDFYQPLKHADIHYLATEGAIKQGASNINSAKVYHTSTLESNDYDDLSLSYMKIKLYQAGIQLDKEHHADKAELSLMTLVISACALKGYTITEALHLYQALASIGEALLSDFYNIVLKYITLEEGEDKTPITNQIRELLYDTLLSTLSKQEVDLNNIASAMAYKIILKYRNGNPKDLSLDEKQLPISDTTMFKKLVSNLAVYLSNKGIKVKVLGILAILNPSYNLFKLYNGKKLEEFTDSKSYVATEGLQKSWKSEVNGELNPSVTYKTTEIRANAESEFYLLLEQDKDGSFNLYQSLNKKAPTILEQNEMLIGVAQYLPMGSIVSSFDEEYELFRLLELGFEKDGERTLPDGKKVPILKKVKSLPKQLLVEQLNSRNVYTRNEEGSKSLVRLGTSYYITREIINELGLTEYITNKESIVTIEDYKKLSKDNSILYIRHNHTDGLNLAAYNTICKAINPENEQVDISLYDSDSIYYLNQFKKLIRKCTSSNKKLLDLLKSRLGINDTALLVRILNQETFDEEMNYYNLVNQLLGTDSALFGDFYFRGKTISNFVNEGEDGKYVDVNRLNKFILHRLSRMALHNLSALSETRDRIEDRFTKDLQEYQNPDSDPGTRTKIYNYWKRYIIGVLKEGYSLNSKLSPEEVFSLVNQYIINTTSILVNGRLHKVLPDTVVILAHECVMPKTMATKYGLQTHDNLSTIISDAGFFYKRFKSKYQRLLTNENDFTLELKRLNGDHVYLINQEDLAQSDLKEKTDVFYNTIDGKLWRVDALGNRIYQVSSPDDKIYINEATGVEVIKTNNFTFYLNNLNYQNIEISRASTWDLLTGELIIPPGSEERIDAIIDAIKNSNNRTAKRVYNYYQQVKTGEEVEDDLTYNQIARGNKERSTIDDNFTTKTDDEVVRDYINGNRSYIPYFAQKMIQNSLEIHSSFLMSLNILAARIPALCMLSFMAMKIVAFNNSDTSNAYVATSQIYLQGSDFDIDAVSLETFAFDDNGRFYDWSPYFNLDSIELLINSLRIPFPTFLEVTQSKNVQDDIIKEFINNGFIKVNESKETIKFNISDIDNLIKFLKITKLPTKVLIFRNDTLNEKLLDEVISFINEHNMYFEKRPIKHIEGASSNYAMYNSYKIAADPANQIQAMTSVDSTTRPMKTEGNKSRKAKALANRGPGNWINKIEAINENAVGKDCIAICATGIKVFTAATFTNNYILNDKPDLLEFLPFEVRSERNDRGDKINVTKKLLANIKAKDPNTVTNDEVYELLLSVNDDTDAALVLSALLSLSTDNAKELLLSKLNATAEMIGMYIYGISIGIDFREIAKVLMSETGELIMKLRSSDSFNDTPTFFNFYSIFDHLEMEPNLQAYSYKVNGIRSPKSFLDEFLQKYADTVYARSESKNKKVTLVEYLFKQRPVTENGVTRAFNIYDLKKLLESDEGGQVFIKANSIVKSSNNELTLSDYEAFKIIWNLMFEYLAEWHQQHKSVSGYTYVSELGRNAYMNDPEFKNLDDEILEKYKKYINFDYLRLKKWAEGASEMKIAGLMLGINKGFKSTIDDIIALKSVIVKAFNDRRQWKTFKINLYNFTKHLSTSDPEPFNRDFARKFNNPRILDQLVFDEAKQLDIIKEYDEIKHTLNLPLILTTQPNYHEYYKALVATDKLLENGSFLYTALTDLAVNLSQDLKIYSSTELASMRRGIEKCITHKIICNFLNTSRDNDGGLIQFEIPTDAFYVSETGDFVINKGGTLSFKTGTDATNYTFKLLMEQVIMPRILNGELTSGSNYFFMHGNVFALNLVPIVNDRTYTKVPVMLITSNINLLPANPEEDYLFKLYHTAFKEIAQHLVDTSSDKSNANSIADLFFVYDLFVNNNSLSQNSFKKFFVSPIETISQLQVNFYNYIKDLDKNIKSSELLLEIIFGSSSLSAIYPELLPYILKPYSGNIEFANAPFVITQESDGSIKIKRKADTTEVDEVWALVLGSEEFKLDKYETLESNRQLNPSTFYGMEIVPGEFITGTFKRKNGDEVTYSYRKLENKAVEAEADVKADVEIEIDGKIYRKQVKMVSDKLDKNDLDGFVESIINPC